MTRFLVFAFLLGSACGKNDAVVAAEAMADAVCACADVACAQAAHRQGLTEVMKHKDSRGTRADAEAIEAAGKRVQLCTAALQQRSR